MAPCLIFEWETCCTSFWKWLLFNFIFPWPPWSSKREQNPVRPRHFSKSGIQSYLRVINIVNKKTIALRWITKRREEAASRENRRNSIPLMQMMKLAILEVEVGSSMTLPKSKTAWIVNVHKMLSLRHSRCTALKKCFRFDLRLQLLWVIRQTGVVRKPMQMWAAGIVPYSTQLFLAIIFRQADKRKKFFAQILFVNRSSCRAEDAHCSED